MISTEMAEKMVADKMSAESKPAQQETEQTKADTTVTPESTEDNHPKVDNPEEGAKGTPEETKVSTDGDGKQPPSVKYSKEERTAHAFAREKQKRKQQREKYEAEIADLKAKLEKYKGLKLEDFNGNTDDFVNFKLEEQKWNDRLKQASDAIQDSEAEELKAETDRRISLSFETEQEREEYNELVQSKWGAFKAALDKFDPNNVVINYLSDLERYPLVLKRLMTDMDALRRVFADKSPVMIKDNLHTLAKEILGASSVKAESKPNNTPPAEPTPKATIPITGRQVSASGAGGEPVHDRAYWNNYLKQHPRG